jgi:hypothetical protein
MVSPVLCDCEALVVQKFRHLGQHFLKPSDFADISISMVLHFVQSGAAECLSKETHKRWEMIEVQGLLLCLPSCTVLQGKEI